MPTRLILAPFLILGTLLTSAPWLMAAPAAHTPPLSPGEQALLNLRVDSVVILESERPLGSGVIISRDGLVITSARVLSKTGSMEARVFNGAGNPPHRTTAQVVARDDWLALLKLEGKDFKPAPLGASEFLKINDRVFVVDHPSGKGFTLALGAVGQVTPFEPTRARLQDTIPTVVPFNQWNVGGPLFNLAGEVVGVMQGSAQWPSGGTKALRVEDVREFLKQVQDRIPPRQVRLRGPARMEVQSGSLPRTPLPTTLDFKLGEVMTLVLLKEGKPCGILRPNTMSLEPLQDLELGGNQPVGTLDVQARPHGAQVEVDGQVLGQSPLQLDCMQPGPRNLRLSMDHHAVDQRTVLVHPAQQTTVELTLRHLEGYLTLESHPVGGEVWLDGKLLGLAPLKNIPVPLGKHTVSVRTKGGARVRREFTFEDQGYVDAGTVNIPSPGALVHVERSRIKSLYIDGQPHKDLGGYVVVKPGTRVFQAEDDLGNVLTAQWEAPPGGHRRLDFQGHSARWAYGLHGVGVASLLTGVTSAALATALVVGIPVAVHLVFFLAGGILDAAHRQAWIPSGAAGAILASPLMLVAALTLAGGLLVPPWEQLFTEGKVVKNSAVADPVSFVPTPGWEPRPVALAEDSNGTSDAPVEILTKPIPESTSDTAVESKPDPSVDVEPAKEPPPPTEQPPASGADPW